MRRARKALARAGDRKRTLPLLAGLMIVSVVVLINVLAAPTTARADIGDFIPFRGLEDDDQGSTAWNASGAGPEAAMTGHAVGWAPCVSVAYYYGASKGYDNIGPTAVQGVEGGPAPISGFPQFSAALAASPLILAQLSMSWGLQTLGGDVEGVDWMYDSPSTVETRYYTGGTFILKLAGEDMVGGVMPRSTLTITYNDTTVAGCFDDDISSTSEVVAPVDMSGGSSAGVQAAAAAFMSDLAGNGIRFSFDSITLPAGQIDFTGNGRTGAFFEIQSGRIEVDELSTVAVPALGQWGLIGMGVLLAAATAVVYLRRFRRQVEAD